MDPFTLVYTTLANILTGYADWAALVQPLNFIRFDEPEIYAPKLDVINGAGDTPMICLAQGSWKYAVTRPSVATEIVQSYPLAILWDNMQMVNFNAIKWQTLRALNNNTNGQLGLSKFVRQWLITDGTDDVLSNNVWKPPGTTKRWTCVTTIHVQMYITQDLWTNQTFQNVPAQ